MVCKADGKLHVCYAVGVLVCVVVLECAPVGRSSWWRGSPALRLGAHLASVTHHRTARKWSA